MMLSKLGVAGRPCQQPPQTLLHAGARLICTVRFAGEFPKGDPTNTGP